MEELLLSTKCRAASSLLCLGAAMRTKRQARLAQSVERQALNLMVVGSSPTVGVFQIPKCRSAGFELARSEKEELRRTHRPEVYLEPKWLR